MLTASLVAITVTDITSVYLVLIYCSFNVCIAKRVGETYGKKTHTNTEIHKIQAN